MLLVTFLMILIKRFKLSMKGKHWLRLLNSILD
ncbi:MAG: KxYKxGKxW signal peptide domain-containing protein [Psychroserpens sp.]|nr:KxYKxGKxW signal peptide domain-containing protein [Psychroserpens sp.]